jgi:hypothetical protein
LLFFVLSRTMASRQREDVRQILISTHSSLRIASFNRGYSGDSISRFGSIAAAMSKGDNSSSID